MEALRRSVGQGQASKPSTGRKEMLLPIAGKKPAKETAAKKPASRQHRKLA